MKNRWALRLAALTLVSCLAMSGVSLAVEPGSASDPLERCVSGTDHDQGRPEDHRPE